jgi:hypothetical protein
MAESKKCPYCGLELNPIEIRNALSRWLKDTYICSDCGNFEAIVDMQRNNKKFCFTSVVYHLGIAVEDQPGYYPVVKGYKVARLSYDELSKIARELNEKLRQPISLDEEFMIVASSMRAQNLKHKSEQRRQDNGCMPPL